MMNYKVIISGLLLAGLSHTLAAQGSSKLLFGDTHLHTSYSFDAYLNKNQTADPDVAYNWAKGLPVIHPLHSARVQIGTPLDFLVVSDHAELMGVIRAMNQGTATNEDLGLWGNLKRWVSLLVLNRAIDGGDGAELFNCLTKGLKIRYILGTSSTF